VTVCVDPGRQVAGARERLLNDLPPTDNAER